MTNTVNPRSPREDFFVTTPRSPAAVAEALLKGIVGDDEGLVCIYNTDGSHLTLHPGFRIAAVEGEYWTKMPSI